MNWYKHLYLGELANKKKSKIIHKLEKQEVALGVYAITLASNGRDLLDVLPAYMLYRDQAREREILGIAVTKEEAFEVCAEIIQDVYQKTGSYEVRSFFA